MQAKFQRNRPSNYRGIVIVTQIDIPSFLHLTCALGVNHMRREQLNTW